MNNLEHEQLTSEAETDIIALNVIKPQEEKEQTPELIKKEIENELTADLEALTISDLSNGEDEDDDEDDDDDEDGENSIAQTVTSDILSQGIEVNYKRMKVNELRAIVKSKGLVEDAKKLKKTQLLQLLNQ